MHAATACAVAVPCRAETAETALRLKFRSGEKSRNKCETTPWQQQQEINIYVYCGKISPGPLRLSDPDLFPLAAGEACSLPRTGGVSLSRAASVCRSAFRDDRLG